MFVLAVILAALAQTVTIRPDTILIPPGRYPLDAWPDFESDPTVGHQQFEVIYTVGSAPMHARGGILIGLGYPTTQHHNPFYAIDDGWMLGPTNALSRFPLGQFQTSDPSHPDFCSATCSVTSLSVDVVKRSREGRDALLKIVTPVSIPAGTPIVVTLGRGIGMSLSWTPGAPKLYVSEDLGGSGTYTTTKASLPTLLFTGQSAERFIVNGPVTAVAGVPVRLTIRAVQGADNPAGTAVIPVENFDAVLRVTSTDGLLANSVTDLSTQHFANGVLSLNVTFHTPGIQTVSVRAGDPLAKPPTNPMGMSNSIVVEPAGTDFEILCGDFHRHAAEGGHAATPGDLCWRDLYDDAQDFGAVVQHSETYMSGFVHANAQAAEFQSLVDPHETRFVCFPGYEFTRLAEHRNVVSQNITGDPAIADGSYAGAETPGPVVVASTQDFLDRLGAMAVPQLAMPHHTVWSGNGRSGPHFDSLYVWGSALDCPQQPIVEIFSSHGSSEAWLSRADRPDEYPILRDVAAQRPRNNLASVRDALKLGYRFGIVAGSDRHGYTNGCTSAGEGYERTGLTFVRTPISGGSRRIRIWNGIERRRVYATTGARIWLDWRTPAGTEMGGEEITASPSFALEAHASGIGIMVRPSFTRAEVVRDDRSVAATTLSASDVHWNWVDPAPLDDRRVHSYYVRIVQDDDHVAWSSPVWVRVP